jgi:hypothetical protein
MIWDCVDFVHLVRNTNSWHTRGLSADLAYETFSRYALEFENDIPLILNRWLCFKPPRGKVFTFLISARYFEAF